MNKIQNSKIVFEKQEQNLEFQTYFDKHGLRKIRTKFMKELFFTLEQFFKILEHIFKKLFLTKRN